MKCACGCGTQFSYFDTRKRPRRFISGHNTRVESGKAKPKVKQLCFTCGKVYYRCHWAANRGVHNYCSNQCRYEKQSLWMAGEKNCNWKGGRAGVQNLRWCPEYTMWKKAVLRTKGKQCGVCGEGSSRKTFIHVHHIKSWATYPEYRFDVNNGLPVCKQCHLKLHTKKK